MYICWALSDFYARAEFSLLWGISYPRHAPQSRADAKKRRHRAIIESLMQEIQAHGSDIY